METKTIYHITTASEWQGAVAKGFYEAPSLKTEGFIHCCANDEQVHGVLQRYFSGKKQLLKLSIDVQSLKGEVKYELAPSINQIFPHIYGVIDLKAVIKTEPI